MVALFVILTFAGFILADGIVQYYQARKEKPALAAVRDPVRSLTHVAVPGGVFLDRGHTWLEIVRSGFTRIGGDAFVGQLVGAVARVDLPKLDQRVRRGEPLVTLHSGSRRVSLASPVDGVVRVVNESLVEAPSNLQDEPYNQGWFCEVEPQNLPSTLPLLKMGRSAQEWISAELDRFREFIASRMLPDMQTAVVLQDGGYVRVGALETVDDETWEAFEREFLRAPSETV